MSSIRLLIINIHYFLILQLNQIKESGNDSKKSESKKFDHCFERHANATEDVKAAVDEAGEYHKFMIAMAFEEESDQVYKTLIRKSNNLTVYIRIM